MAERWVDCTRSPLYEVSDQGRVRRKDTGRLLMPAHNHKQNRQGYLKVSLGRRCQVYVHQLVAEAFIGPRPPGHDVDHISHDRLDNSAANLRYLPKIENAFRWKGCTPEGRIVWDSPYLEDDTPPDYEPMTAEEIAAWEHEMEAAGWTAGRDAERPLAQQGA